MTEEQLKKASKILAERATKARKAFSPEKRSAIAKKGAQTRGGSEFYRMMGLKSAEAKRAKKQAEQALDTHGGVC